MNLPSVPLRMHWCPLHGDEVCLMGSKSMSHGCRQGAPLVFRGPTEEKYAAVITALLREQMNR